MSIASYLKQFLLLRRHTNLLRALRDMDIEVNFDQRDQVTIGFSPTVEVGQVLPDLKPYSPGQWLLLEAAPHSAEARELVVQLCRAAHFAMDDSEQMPNGDTAISEAAATDLTRILDAMDQLPELPQDDAYGDGYYRALYFSGLVKL